MPGKKSTTVVVKRLPKKHHRVPAGYRTGPPIPQRGYGNGYDGSNVKPKPAPAPSSGDYWAG
jgi:hypothetical protein